MLRLIYTPENWSMEVFKGVTVPLKSRIFRDSVISLKTLETGKMDCELICDFKSNLIFRFKFRTK